NPRAPRRARPDLGSLRGVRIEEGGTVTVRIPPTYSGCPALAEMRADVYRAVRAAGFDRVEVRTELSPAWTSDWITEEGRRKLTEHGISPPGRAPARADGPVPLVRSEAHTSELQ